MKLLTTLLISFLLFKQFCYAQLNPDSIFLHLALQKTAQTKVFSYEFAMCDKSVGDDVISKPWQGVAYVAPDSFFCKYSSWGGRVCDYYGIRIADSSVRYFFINKKKQFDWLNTNNEQFAPKSGFNCYSNLAQVDKPIYYTQGVKYSNLGDTNLNGMKCRIMLCNAIESNLSDWSETRFYINLADSFLVGFESFVGFGGFDTIYRGYFFKNIKYNNRFDDGELKHKLATFKDITFDSILNPPFIPAKAKGEKIASFVTSALFNNNKQVLKTEGKVILLDFWYMSCYACILSYPVINRLHEEYKENKLVEIYSVNAFDVAKKKDVKLKDYVKKYEMNSNLVKMDDKEFSQFKINAYPAFYVLVDGVVKAIKSGTDDDLYKDLKALIDDGLTQLK